MKNKKKVIIIITEGIYDIDLLKPFIDEIIDKSKIKFEISNGDLLTKSNNIRKSPKNIVGDFISEICKRRKYRDEDILFVAHILDLDGSYISPNNIKIDNSINVKKVYDLESNLILVNNEAQKSSLLTTWERKFSRQKVLYSSEKIKKLDYYIFYNSINLEHVLSNKVLVENSEKEDCIESFTDSTNLMDFISFLTNPDILIGTTYSDSWNNLDNYDGFKRASNLIFLINKIMKYE
ncbi:hypothetical protein [Carnobacterium divergens]|uniref:hypothetical protein n=1 Tax=Carnobacterium divergens TaxID=2748 RepID=UPI002891CBE0|nr:hypothetical protein [Carnobacterium divergens]MDT2010682.1 hypothetical protein [Carnobacterium divergens]